MQEGDGSQQNSKDAADEGEGTGQRENNAAKRQHARASRGIGTGGCGRFERLQAFRTVYLPPGKGSVQLEASAAVTGEGDRHDSNPLPATCENLQAF
jgi:hypothetical protein